MILKINTVPPFKKKNPETKQILPPTNSYSKIKQNVPFPNSEVKKPNCGSPLSSQAFNIQLSLTSSSQHSLVSYPAVNPLSPVSSSYIHKHDFRSQNLTNSKRRMLM